MQRIKDNINDEYKIIQDRDCFSYGVDAVLLSHFSEIRKKDTVLDIGTGNAIIPILLAMNNSYHKIYGIEKQKDVAALAKENITMNKLENIEIINEDIHKYPYLFTKGSFDVITINPPYFKLDSAIKNTSDNKMIARHETTAVLEDFVRISSELLKDRGRFYMIHRPSRLVDIISYLRLYRLEPKLIQFIYPYQRKEPNMVLIKAVKNGKKELKYLDNLFVYKNGEYTKELLKIYDDLQIKR